MSTANVPARTDTKAQVPALKENPALNTIKHVLIANKSKIEAALPRHVTPSHMIRVTLNSLAANPSLLACTKESVFGCVIEAATYGWEIGGAFAEAYMVPFRNSKAQTVEAVLIPGYRGLLNLCRNSGAVQTLFRGVVRECDKFQYSMTLEPPIIWEQSIEAGRKDSPIRCVFVLAKMMNGGFQPLVVPYQELLEHRDAFSQSYRNAEKNGKKDSAWHTHEEIMLEKTVIRRFITQGHVPLSAEMRNLAMRRDPYEDAIDGTVVSQAEQLNLGDTTTAAAALPAPAAEEEAISDGGAVDPAWSKQIGEAVAKLNTVGECNDFQKANIDTECQSPEEREEFELIVECRKEEIRAARGTNSNKKK